MKITVKRKHIDRARRLLSGDNIYVNKFCPIALAIKEKTHRNVNVAESHVEVGNKQYDLPLKAMGFIASFDCEARVKPFSFEMFLES